MASSTDFKKIYDLYQVEGIKKGISIVQFCKMNGIVYSHFERWYKQDRVLVKIVDCDSLWGSGILPYSLGHKMLYRSDDVKQVFVRYMIEK